MIFYLLYVTHSLCRTDKDIESLTIIERKCRFRFIFHFQLYELFCAHSVGIRDLLHRSHYFFLLDERVRES